MINNIKNIVIIILQLCNNDILSHGQLEKKLKTSQGGHLLIFIVTILAHTDTFLHLNS